MQVDIAACASDKSAPVQVQRSSGNPPCCRLTKAAVESGQITEAFSAPTANLRTARHLVVLEMMKQAVGHDDVK